MTDYTLTTEQVRNAFSLMEDDAATQENFENFDRWLAEVIRKAKYEAWDEGSADGVWNFEHKSLIERTLREPIENPYRQGEQE